MSEASLRFDDRLEIRCPASLVGLVKQCAANRLMLPAEYARQALTEALRRDGVDLAVVLGSKSAGELYDVRTGGKRRFALIVDGAIATMSYHDAKPEDGRTWLPVVHVDSEPLDIGRHWRLKPDARIDGDRVVVTFPVVVKSLEHA